LSIIKVSVKISAPREINSFGKGKGEEGAGMSRGAFRVGGLKNKGRDSYGQGREY
jgi:hypothetical protein